MDLPKRIDYLVIGHICRDLTEDGPSIGGTAAYSAATAQTLGCRTAVVSSYNESDSWQEALPEVTIVCVPAAETTTFVNRYEAEGRIQSIHAVANNIGIEDIPVPWRRAKIAHIGPVANEVDPEVITIFSNSLVGLTPQGWMRRWDDSGRVQPRTMQNEEQLLPLAAVTFISDEDLAEPAMLGRFLKLSKVLVMTQGPAGCIVYFDNEVRSIRAPKVIVEDTTGAGDIFATAYLIRLHQTGGDPWEAAHYANGIAAQSVTASGLLDKMKVLQDYQRYVDK